MQMISQRGEMPQAQSERATILQQGNPAAGAPQQPQQISPRRPTPELQQRAMKVVAVLREQFRAWSKHPSRLSSFEENRG